MTRRKILPTTKTIAGNKYTYHNHYYTKARAQKQLKLRKEMDSKTYISPYGVKYPAKPINGRVVETVNKSGTKVFAVYTRPKKRRK